MEGAQRTKSLEPEFYAFRSDTYRPTAQRDLAAADVERALALNDDFPEALAGQLRLHAKASAWDEFEESAAQLVELYPDLKIGRGRGRNCARKTPMGSNG